MGKNDLKRISSLHSFFLALGCIIGWGSFMMPSAFFLPESGSPGSVLGLILAAAVAMVFCSNYQYLLQVSPGVKGSYRYVEDAIGADHAFFCAWVTLLAYISIFWANVCAFSRVIGFVAVESVRFGPHYHFAGQDIYLADIFVSAVMLFVCGLIFSHAQRYLFTILGVLVAITVISTAVFFLVVMLREDTGSIFAHGFSVGGRHSAFMQVVSVAALCPWLFIGFETVFDHEETAYTEKSPAPRLAILCGMLIYVMILLLNAVSFDRGESVISFLPGGVTKPSFTLIIPVFTDPVTRQLSHVLIPLAFLSAVSTSVLGYLYVIIGQIRRMAGDAMLPPRFLWQNERGTGGYALSIVTFFTMVVLFLGQRAIGWTVDVTTLCITIVYGYISVSAYKKAAKKESARNRMVAVAGMILAFVIFSLMISPDTLLYGLSSEEYMVFALWCLYGVLCYYQALKRDEHDRLGHSLFMCLFMVFLLLFSTECWTQKLLSEGIVRRGGTADDDLTLLAGTASLLRTIVFILALLLLYKVVSVILIRQRRFSRFISEAKQENKKTTSMIVNMSHDIRTPLNAILGFSDLGLRDQKDPKRMADYLTRINISSGHLLSLVNDVVELSRIETGEIRINKESAYLPDLLHGWEESLCGRAQSKGHRFAIGMQEVSDKGVLCDRHRLTQVISIITTNLINMLPDGGAISIELLQLTPEYDRSALYEFRLSADGAGVTEETAAMYREAIASDKSRDGKTAVEGSVDLSLAKTLLAMMGGSMEIHYVEGEGLVIYLTLELAVSDISVKAKQEPAVSFAGRRALITEDILVNRQIAAEMLKVFGFEVDEAADGRIAVEIMSEVLPGHYDVILMDIRMPGLNGYEATKRIRSLPDPINSGVPIIALTADVLEDDRRKAREAGMNGFVEKPLRPDALIEALLEVLP